MKPNYTVRHELEDLIDECGLCAVLSMIADVCRGKSEYLWSNCRDARAASVWLHAGCRVGMAAFSEAVTATSYGKGE